MKSKTILIAGLGLIILIAVLTNPDQDRHKEVIKNKLKVYIQKSMKESMTETDDEWEQAGQALGVMIGGVIIDGVVNNLISTNNYVLFSTTKITWEGQTRIIGIGAFGNVFLTSKLDETLTEGLLNQK